MADLPDEINGLPKRKYLFQLDCEHMDWCDAVLFLFDGRVPDEGACFELGYCYAKGKLKPDRVYDLQAKWSENEDLGHGLVHYYLVTEKLIMEDGPGSVMMGGWTPAEDPAVTEERMAVFEQGIAALTGVSYIPVAYLGSQVVAGRNHAFLRKSVTAYPGSLEAEPAYVIVYLYQDLRGNVSVLSISDFDLGSLCSTI